MTRKELAEKVANKFDGITKDEVNVIIREAFNIIKDELADGGEFQIAGMGKFFTKEVPAKTYFGEYEVPAHKSVRFKTSKAWTVK